MSFNKGFWMTKGPGSLSDGEMAYETSSRIEPKRSHQWFMDGTDAELFPSKKQAVEVPNPNSFSGLLNSNISAWENASSFNSVAGQFTERLFDHETARTVNFDDRNLPSVGMGSMNMGRKVVEDPFGIESSFGLSISHRLEDPRSGLNYGAIRKVKVSQVKNAENFISVSMGHSFSTADNSTMSTGQAYTKADDNCISMGLSFNRGNDIMIPMAQTFNRGDNIGISMGRTYRENTDSLPIGHSVSKDDTNNTAIAQAFIKGDENGVPLSTFKENESSISVGLDFSKDDSANTSLCNTFNKGVCSTTSIGNKVEDDRIAMGKVDNSSLSIGHSFTKGESNFISFGGLNDDDDDDDPSRRLICSYDLLVGQKSGQRSEEPSGKSLVESNGDSLGSAAQMNVSGGTKKKEEQKATKKAPPNNFPSNVRSLLSTGMLDGVHVKYVAWSREKELRGIIKGSAYLCGCQSCNYAKAINAYEFERHAGYKTKHPNNHIYFENGKTVYGIVQELRNTPQSLLFEVIQTITGSPINQKSFRLWKESFLAATRELQRIYGKEEGNKLS